ncbi:hypothetical protein [Actinomycetospora atypica]|uniref:Uncharacterized protein n=1 Tax=Actinomycetospora atypica TaxID=1290095 RepID=A0ABV9YKH4_9PSEU
MSLSADRLGSASLRLPVTTARAAESERRPSRSIPLLVALALGAMAVVALVLPRVPALADAVGMGAAPAAAPVAPPIVVTAVVTATASCVSADPHDRVTLEVAGVRREAVLDGCGRSAGFPVPVSVPADGAITGPLGVVGSGATARPATTDVSGEGVSPLVARLEIALAVAAALGAGSLLVVVARGAAPARPRREIVVPVPRGPARRAAHGRRRR